MSGDCCKQQWFKRCATRAETVAQVFQTRQTEYYLKVKLLLSDVDAATQRHSYEKREFSY
jgi:hypothetical protein